MPYRIPHPCDHPGCIHRKPCPTHSKQKQRAYDRARGTAAQRGYDAAWQKLSDDYSAEHPTCERCGRPRVTVSTPQRKRDPVHHRKTVREAPHLRLVWTNCEAVCQSCHNAEHPKERW